MSYDQVKICSNFMKKVLISEFKAKCIGMINEIQETGETLIITRRGKPVATVAPAKPKLRKRVLGALQGTVVIKGDIVNSDFSEDWEIFKE